MAKPIRRERWKVLVALIALAAGVGLRWWVLTSALGVADLDEATVGVQARGFAHGDVAAFFLNQPYGGTLETAFVAVSLEVFGSSVLALKLVPMALALVAAVLVWRTAIELELGPTAQLCAPIVMWCGPAAGIWLSTKERGFYGVALVLAAAYPLLALRLERSPTNRDVALLGLCVGLGWWQTPLTLLVAVPVVLWLAWARPALVRGLSLAVPAAVLGALPWLGWNATNGWASLEARTTFGTGWWDRLGDWLDRIPVLLGIETPFDAHRQLVPLQWAGWVVLLVVVVVASRRTAGRAPWLLAAMVVGYGFLYALNGLAGGVGADPRYGYLMLPVLALCLAAMVPELPSPLGRFLTTGAVIIVSVGLAAWGLVGLRAVGDGKDPSPFLTSEGIEDVATLLRDRRIDAAITDIAGMQLAFLTEEQVVGGSFAAPRLPDFERRARAADPSTYVLDIGLLGNVEVFDRWLRVNQVGYESVRVGKWQVFFLDRRVSPDDAGVLVYGGQLGDLGPGYPAGGPDG